jgi:anaerobic dimethyl sulfoxide reductase subunit B (iron-sulfur subunit)
MDNTVKQYAFYFDQGRCTGCQTCVIACKDWNQVKPGPASYRHLYDTEEGDFPNVNVFMTIYSCNHCEHPACVDACPYSAIYKRKKDGIVVINTEVCQGVTACKSACPYSAPQFASDEQETPALSLETASKGHKAQKCTMCWDRVANDMKPACVGSCLARALDFGTIDELRRKYPDAKTLKDGGVLKGFPSDERRSDGGLLAQRTNPSFLFKAKE